MQHVSNPMAGRTKRIYTPRRVILSSAAALWMLAGLTLFFSFGAEDSAIASIAVLPLIVMTICWTVRPVP